LTGSLPQLEGEAVLAGLDAPVLVERDGLGVPAIRASSRLDLARATGFVQAQERMFQMDLLRRQAAGELAELFGPAALELDRAHRVHRFRAVARETLAASPAAAREMIEAFAAGANAGLSALAAAPPEYQLLRQDPVPWRPEDTVLCVLAMYLDLQGGDGARESALGVLTDVMPPALVAFLTPPGDEWDAPLVGGPLLGPPIPGPSQRAPEDSPPTNRRPSPGATTGPSPVRTPRAAPPSSPTTCIWGSDCRTSGTARRSCGPSRAESGA
jgi:penicillin amidase